MLSSKVSMILEGRELFPCSFLLIPSFCIMPVCTNIQDLRRNLAAIPMFGNKSLCYREVNSGSTFILGERFCITGGQSESENGEDQYTVYKSKMYWC